MGRFATGRHAFGISDRSGFRYKLRDMKKEWNGLLVGKDEFERKHPQLIPRKNIPDAEALKDSRPLTNLEFERRTQYGFNPVGFVDPLDFITSNLVATGTLGSVSISGSVTSSQESESTESSSTSGLNVTLSGTVGSIGSVTITTNLTVYAVTVADYGGSNYFYIDGSRAVTLNLTEGSIYRFDQSDSSNSSHPLRFSTASDGTHGGGSEYTTGVTTNGSAGSEGAYTQITVASGAPTLYYYCTNHSGMGGQINT